MNEQIQSAQPPAKLSVEKNSRGYTDSAVVCQQAEETDQQFRKRLESHMSYLKETYEAETAT
ncbi:MAG: hypothetical protein R3A46_15025 [Thermomicrobiales bacterium]